MRLSPSVTFVLTLIAAGGVLAQAVPQSTSLVCRSSALSLCRNEALSGDRAGVKACLIRNFDKVSPECQAAMKAAQAKAAAGKAGKPEAATPTP